MKKDTEPITPSRLGDPTAHTFELSQVQVLDAGQGYVFEPPTRTRYRVEALASDPNDSTRVASVAVANCYTLEMATLTAAAIRAYIKDLKPAVLSYEPAALTIAAPPSVQCDSICQEMQHAIHAGKGGTR